jgi:transcriptional regulator with XRE-family HTH domain
VLIWFRIRRINRETEYRQFLKSLGKYLRHYMMATGCSQAEIAERAGLTSTTIWMIIHGHRQAVPSSTLWNILEAC